MPSRSCEIQDHCEALENALAEIKAATFEPKTELSAGEAADPKILLAVRDRGGKPGLRPG